MVENGYLIQERSAHDRRSIRVRLSEKGLNLRKFISEMFDRQAAALGKVDVEANDLRVAADAYRGLERFWIDLLNFNLRGAASGL